MTVLLCQRRSGFVLRFAHPLSQPESVSSPSATGTPSVTATPKPSASKTPPSDRDGDGAYDSADDFPDDGSRSKQLYYPSGDPVVEGYPVLVDTAQIDYRVANAIKTPQAVAVAPGVYVGYNSAVPDFRKYIEGGTDGDCVVREAFGFFGGSCWNGVPPSPAEPAQ